MCEQMKTEIMNVYYLLLFIGFSFIIIIIYRYYDPINKRDSCRAIAKDANDQTGFQIFQNSVDLIYLIQTIRCYFYREFRFSIAKLNVCDENIDVQ